jgi:hypothetical protein
VLPSFSLDFDGWTIVLAFRRSACDRAQIMRESPNLAHISPHLREVCAILAAGLVRLYRHIARTEVDDAGLLGGQADISLHFQTDKSGHAFPNPRRNA